jgi:hypothetical protein
MLRALLVEPPFRSIVKAAVRYLPVSILTKDRWNAADRPQYLAGIVYAAMQAKRERKRSISAIEFGVADGHGLVVMQSHAAAVERETGIRVLVYGFDNGDGLPEGTNDHRDHPDIWQAGDYRMNIPALRGRLTERSKLVLGDVRTTVLSERFDAPIGFMSMDLDLYSSTVHALGILTRSEVPRLNRVAMYFDDLSDHYNHQWAGELLALNEFNARTVDVKIDRWRGIQFNRPFHEAPWIQGMYIAHHLAGLDRTRTVRPPAEMGW